MGQVKKEHYKALGNFYTAVGLLDHEVRQGGENGSGEEGGRRRRGGGNMKGDVGGRRVEGIGEGRRV